MITRNANYFRLWTSRLDIDLIKASVTIEGWVFVALFVYGSSLGVEAFSLNIALTVPLSLFALCFLHGLYVASRVKKDAFSQEKLGFHILVGAFLMMAYMTSNIAFSTGIAKVLYCFIFVLTAAVLGFSTRSSKDTPYGTIASILGVGAVGFAAPSSALTTAEFFLIALPVSAIFQISLGTWAYKTDLEKEERLAFRETIHAQRISSQHTLIERYENRLTKLKGYRHDMNNVTTVLSIVASIMQEEATEEDEEELASDLVSNIQRLCNMMDTMFKDTKASLDRARQLEASYKIKPLLEIQEVASGFRKSFPQVQLNLLTLIDSSLNLSLYGDREAFSRVLLNLLKNAVEGNGAEGASVIDLHADIVGTQLAIIIADDGPGFPEHKLLGPTLYDTTKDYGTGLGLYTVEKLVNTHGGTLVLENRELPFKGAKVITTWNLEK